MKYSPAIDMFYLTMGDDAMRFSMCCKDCPERVSLCHATCERYREARAELDEAQRLKREAKLLYPIHDKRFINRQP